MIYVSSLIARSLNRLGLLPIFRIGYKLTILGKTFSIPIIENKEGFNYHQVVSEPYMLKIFQHLFTIKNYTFLDAGVNFGQTLLKIKAVSPNAEYIGFEPSGLCSYFTSHLIRVNKISRAKLIRCALSNSPGVLTLQGQSEGDTRATIMDGMLDPSENIFHELVPAVTLDSLVSVISAAGRDIILKIDVEGAEWLVFQGSEHFINDYRPVVVFENLPYQDDVSKLDQQQKISEFFLKKNYGLYLIDEHTSSLANIGVINNKNEYQKTNYLGIPAEQQDLISMPSR